MLDLSHKKLRVWQMSVEFVTQIYNLTHKFPKEELYVLTSQIRRAAISVPSNLAEGAARRSVIEKKRFFEIARSSLVEIETQLEIAKRLNFCSERELIPLGENLNHIFASLSKLIQKTGAKK